MFQKVKTDFASHSLCPQTKDVDKSQPLLQLLYGRTRHYNCDWSRHVKQWLVTWH